MKKAIKLTIVLTAFVFLNASSQENKNTFGIGFQSSFPVYGISLKYAIAPNHVLQATIAPFGVGSYKVNYFGARYMYRFQPDENLNPYLFGGAGIITTNYDYGDGQHTNVFSYSLGGGIEYIAAYSLGLSADLGYGTFNLNNTGEAASGIFLGVGIHYYIK